MTETIDFKALSAPIPDKLVKKRKQGGVLVDYITARVVMDRLDSVVGPANWRDEYKPLESGAVECTLYLRVGDEWIGKTDVGVPSNYEPQKGVYSDALKRAAVRWGIARELYGDGLGEAPAADDDAERPVDPDSLENTFGPRHSIVDEPEPPPAHTWADDDAVTKMLVWLRDELWLEDGQDKLTWPHVYARVGKALHLSAVPKNRAQVAAMIRNELLGDKATIVRVLKAYEPETTAATGD